MLSTAGAESKAHKQVTIRGDYETRDGGSCALEFEGSVTDAQPVREFLQDQLRAAESSKFEIGLALAFAEGLPMGGDAPEQLAKRVSRFSSGAAYVKAFED